MIPRFQTSKTPGRLAGSCSGPECVWALFCLFISVLQIQLSRESYKYLMKIWRAIRKPHLLSLFNPCFRYAVAGDMLQIMNVALSDGGTYTCIARTSLDETNATALLTVLGETGLGTMEPRGTTPENSWDVLCVHLQMFPMPR